eukprot:6204409-Pleurochrysis_carterae.AAC.3
MAGGSSNRGRGLPPFLHSAPELEQVQPPQTQLTSPRDASSLDEASIIVDTFPLCTSACIANLPPEATAEVLTELMLQMGPMQGDVRLLKDPYGNSKGVAFCDFLESRSAFYAMAVLDGLQLHSGHRLRVNPANSRGQATPAILEELNQLACCGRRYEVHRREIEGRVPKDEFAFPLYADRWRSLSRSSERALSKRRRSRSPSRDLERSRDRAYASSEARHRPTKENSSRRSMHDQGQRDRRGRSGRKEDFPISSRMPRSCP